MAYKYRPSVAVDLDGVILEYDGWKGPDHFGGPLPGAGEFLKSLRKMGLRIIIHTARVNSAHPESLEEVVSQIEGILKAWSLPFNEVWVGQGKPIALAYIDDRAIFMNSRTCQSKMAGWKSALAEISVAKAEADSRHTEDPNRIPE